MSADILTSCNKIAEAMIPVKESPPPPLVEPEEDSSDNEVKTTTNDELKQEAKVSDEPVLEEEDTEVNVIQKVL